ncbi:MAG: AI-2E family transporter [Actinomycetota bacterium]|nr:AI-2E family transporter [Actinomycetota bacterium]
MKRRARQVESERRRSLAERMRAASRTQDPRGLMSPRAQDALKDDTDESGDAAVPDGIRTAAAWSWRFLLVIAALYALLYLLVELSVVVIPVVVALLLAALLQPAAAWLTARGWPRSLSAAVVLVGGIAVVTGIIWLVVAQISSSFGVLSTQVGESIDSVRNWLVNGPLSLSQTQLNDAFESAQDTLANNQDLLTSGALTTAVTVGHVVTGLALALFTLFFFLQDGRGIWSWLNRLFPTPARPAIDEAASRSWRTLISYVRATAAVALFDAVIIGIGLLILRVPLAIPLAALVFLGAFIPIIGSFIAGLVAVLIALVSNGFVVALIVLGVIIGVMQFEGHVLQPLLLGRAVQVHPLAVVLAIAAGLLLGGIFGALIAVPIVACTNVATAYLMRRSHQAEDPGTPLPGEPVDESGSPLTSDPSTTGLVSPENGGGSQGAGPSADRVPGAKAP